jgi:hypothetical protein
LCFVAQFAIGAANGTATPHFRTTSLQLVNRARLDGDDIR